MGKDKQYHHRNMPQQEDGFQWNDYLVRKFFDFCHSKGANRVKYWGKDLVEEFKKENSWPKRPKYKVPSWFESHFGGNKPAPESATVTVQMPKKKEWSIRKAIVTLPGGKQFHLEEEDTISINVYVDDPAFYVKLTIEEAVRTYKGEIKSVRRESDQEVFSIGDIDARWGKIIGFEFSGNYLTYNCDDGKEKPINVGFHDWKKRNEPLLTTEDGVQIFDPKARIWLLHEKEWNTNNIQADYAADNAMPSWKRFSSEEARNEYILNNQPCLSLKDIISSTITNIGDGSYLIKAEHLKRIAKEKLKLK